ncbi:EamA family transporter [Labrys okinawensis]|uniref:EamA family transporter n=1 Tax=Labrys okinawensis TaxID=346911 RepID=UPI0039BC2827
MLAVVMALVAIASKQLGAALSRPVMDSYGALATTSERIGWAALILSIIARPKVHTYSKTQWIAALLLGATIGTMMLTVYAAIARVPLGLVVAIDFLGPLSVAAFGLRRSWRLTWPVIALAGVLLLVRTSQGWSADPLGIALAFLGAICWALFIILMKRIGSVFQGLEGLAISFITAAFITIPIGLVESGLPPAGDLLSKAAGLAILTPLLPYAMEVVVLRRLPSATFGILASLEPAVAALAGFVILQQALSMQQTLGIACVVIASIGAVTYAVPDAAKRTDQSAAPKAAEDMP